MIPSKIERFQFNLKASIHSPVTAKQNLQFEFTNKSKSNCVLFTSIQSPYPESLLDVMNK